MSDIPNRLTVIKRGLCGLCPNCGQGRLFASYLKATASCAHCSENYSEIRADDGPTWLTVMVTGHLVVPVSIYLAMQDVARPWLAFSMVMLFTLLAVLVILPRAKGIFIGMLWLGHKTRGQTVSKYEKAA